VKLIDRYVGGQLLVTFSLAVSVLSVVLVLGNVFKQLLDLLVKNDTPIEVVLSFLSYILPFSLAFTIPWAFLTTVLLVFGRLSADHELTAFRASGVSIPRLCYTVFLLAVACVATCFYINIDVAPRAQAKMKEALYNVAVSNPLAMFGADRVIDEFPNKKIFVGSNKGPELHDLLVYQITEDNLLMKVIFARRGLLETDQASKQLLLHIYDATYEARDDDDQENLLKIKQGITMKESTMAISLEELHEKYRSHNLAGLTSQALLDKANENEREAHMTEKQRIEDSSATLTEINKRYSFSLAALCFALVGVPLAITAHRKETSIGFLISLCVALVYYFFIIIANTVREKPQWHPAELVWVPNILCVIFGGWLFYRMSRR